MYCKNCGNYLEDSCTRCGVCGMPCGTASVPTAPVPAAPAGNSNVGLLVWGILGLGFSISVYFSLLGLIFSIIAQVKINRFQNEGGILIGPSKVGNVFAKLGLIIGAVWTAISVLFIILIIAANL